MTTDRKPARMHKQIVRTMAIIEVLQKGMHDIEHIIDFVNQVIPEPVHSRTIRRDLDALESLGYCTCIRSARTRTQYTIAWPIREIVIGSKISITNLDAKKSRFLELASQKITNRAIADELHISIATVVDWRKKFNKRKTKPYKRKSNRLQNQNGSHPNSPKEEVQSAQKN